MENTTVEYRGFQIVVTPIKDHEDLWDFTYQISKAGDTDPPVAIDTISRTQTLAG